MNSHKTNQSEVLLWSMALPGFGQFLNKKYVKGIVLIALEFIVNVKGKINEVIMYSFLGEIEQAIRVADYLWLMFYPCLYLFAIWDAYRDAGGAKRPYSYLPYVFSAYIGTIGVIYSPRFTVYGYYIGPVFLPIFGMVGGFIFGYVLRKMILSFRKSKKLD